MKFEQIKTNNQGSVVNDGIHDSEIITIDMQPKSSVVSISIKSEDGFEFLFKLIGVEHLDLQHLGLQNIISEVLIIKNQDVSGWLTQNKDFDSYAGRPAADFVKAVNEGQLYFVAIIPATGGEIMVLSKTVEL